MKLYRIKLTGLTKIAPLAVGLLSISASAAVNLTEIANYPSPEVFYSETNETDPSGGSPDLTHTFNQFDGDVSDLISFTFLWDITFSCSATASESGEGGGGSYSSGGDFLANTHYLGENSGGVGGGVGPGETLDISFRRTFS